MRKMPDAGEVVLGSKLVRPWPSPHDHPGLLCNPWGAVHSLCEDPASENKRLGAKQDKIKTCSDK